MFWSQEIRRDRMESVTTAPAAAPASAGVRWETAYAFRVMVTDVIVVAAAVLLAQYVRFGQSPLDVVDTDRRWALYSLLFALLWLSSLAIFRTRSPRLIGAGIEEYRQVVNGSFWTFGAIAIAALLLKLEPSRGYLAVALPIGTLGLLVDRWAWRKQVCRERARGGYQTSVLAIGQAHAVTALAREMTRTHHHGYRIVGFGLHDYADSDGEDLLINGQRIPILGNAADALAAVKQCGADTVAITGTEHFGPDGLRKLLWELDAQNVDLVVSPGVIDVAAPRLVLRPVSGYSMLHVEKPQYQGAKRFHKRAFDFMFALAALTAASPILVCAAIAIKLTSRGPVFYTAERVGLDGQSFTMHKLRTMVANADELLAELADCNESPGDVLFKIREDPRITVVGTFLRRFSIDEIPQFFNVLKGQMAVVGPRPPLRREVQTYDGEVNRRLLVRPGVTGLWQVSGRSDLTWDESVRLDLSYVENWSMVTDVVIIIKTLRAVFLRQGAY